VKRAALDEKALHRIDRRELFVPLGERERFGLDAEEFCQEVFYVRRERHEKV